MTGGTTWRALSEAPQKIRRLLLLYRMACVVTLAISAITVTVAISELRGDHTAIWPYMSTAFIVLSLPFMGYTLLRRKVQSWPGGEDSRHRRYPLVDRIVVNSYGAVRPMYQSWVQAPSDTVFTMPQSAAFSIGLALWGVGIVIAACFS